MCVIIVCKTRGLTEKEVTQAFRANDDGAGYAWYDSGKIRYKKGFMEVEHVIDAYFSGGVNNIFPHIIHFRNATNKVTRKLTHPFIISEKSSLKLTHQGTEPLLFHNGILPDWKNKMLDFYLNNAKKIPDGDFSDSRFIAIMAHFLGHNILSILGDKFVIITPTSIDLYGKFEEDDGIVATNKSYKTGNVVYTKSQKLALSSLGNSNLDIGVLEDIPDEYGN
jgi:hypothetical protein